MPQHVMPAGVLSLQTSVAFPKSGTKKGGIPKRLFRNILLEPENSQEYSQKGWGLSQEDGNILPFLHPSHSITSRCSREPCSLPQVADCVAAKDGVSWEDMAASVGFSVLSTSPKEQLRCKSEQLFVDQEDSCLGGPEQPVCGGCVSVGGKMPTGWCCEIPSPLQTNS